MKSIRKRAIKILKKSYPNSSKLFFASLDNKFDCAKEISAILDEKKIRIHFSVSYAESTEEYRYPHVLSVLLIGLLISKFANLHKKLRPNATIKIRGIHSR